MLLNTHVNWGLHLLQIIISPIKFLFLFQFPVEKLLSGEYLNWYNQTSALQLRKRITHILTPV